MRLECAQLCAGLGIPKRDDPHRVPRNNRSVATKIECQFDTATKCANGVPQYADRPHKCSLRSSFVCGKPVCDSACYKIPFSDTAISTASYKPYVGPVCIILAIRTIVRFCGDFSGGTTVVKNWGAPSDTEEARFYFSEFAKVREAIVLNTQQLDQTVFTPKSENRRLGVR